jgi:hypothetical protein
MEAPGIFYDISKYKECPVKFPTKLQNNPQNN